MTTDYTIKLAALGAHIMCLWGFDTDRSGADTVAAVNDAIYSAGLDYTDLAQVRAIARQHDLNAGAFGDTAPTLVATEERPDVDLDRLQELCAEHSDAAHGDSNDRELAAAHNLITELLRIAGFKLVDHDGNAR
ncbi:hypothetical protein [Leucobacter musarum]|uniref:hypothetical protein n=1 Tax=Leucobacter musarum TaxID=1930747 RepID=UPI0006A76A05|nr:hypothetical protein [Leucobacter musarum]